MLVLGIETSCDETGVAVYDSDRGLLAHTLYSQVKLHADYGGVVPELASRDHIRKILPLLDEVLESAGVLKQDLDEINTIKKILSSQQKCWNNGDIDGFMQGYWNSEKLVFHSIKPSGEFLFKPI